MIRIKTNISFIVFIILFFSCLEAKPILVEARAAYYYPTDSTFREIYGKTGLYSIEANYNLVYGLYSWGSVGYLRKSGKSLDENDHTTATIIPINFGLKYIFCCGCFRPYIGGGVSFSYLHTNNSSPYVIKSQGQLGAGGIAKAGLIYFVNNCWFLDVFLDYTSVVIKFRSTPLVFGRDSDISSLTAGIGLGYQF